MNFGPLAKLALALAHPRATLVGIAAVGLTTGGMMGLAGVGVAYAGQRREALAASLAREAPPPEVVTDLSKPATAPEPPRVTATEQRLGEGRTLVSALRALGLTQEVASRVVLALGRQIDPRLMRPTDLVRVERDAADEGVLKRVVYRRSESRAWVVAPNESGDLVASVAPAVQEGAAAGDGSVGASAGAGSADVVPAVTGASLMGALPGLDPPAAGSSSGSASSGPPVRAQGFNHGQPMSLTVITVDGKPVEVSTARAFERMRDAARRDGVYIQIVSGFRTMEQQRNLYALYRSGRGNLAAVPGFSNHQSGHALDLNTSARGVYAWMSSHAASFGFRRTVPSEAWHWEHW